jgi:hypothetical protein
MRGDHSYGTREPAGDANRKDTSASGEMAGIDEPGEGRTALVDNARGAKRRILDQPGGIGG